MTSKEIKKTLETKWRDENTEMKAKVLKNTKNLIQIRDSYLEGIISIKFDSDGDNRYCYWTESIEDDELKRGFTIIGNEIYCDCHTDEEALKEILIKIGYSTANRY